MNLLEASHRMIPADKGSDPGSTGGAGLVEQGCPAPTLGLGLSSASTFQSYETWTNAYNNAASSSTTWW